MRFPNILKVLSKKPSETTDCCQNKRSPHENRVYETTVTAKSIAAGCPPRNFSSEEDTGSNSQSSSKGSTSSSWWESVAIKMENPKINPVEPEKIKVSGLASRGNIKVFLNYKKLPRSSEKMKRDKSCVHDDDPVFRQIFDIYDKNGDNVINVEELSGILEILGYTPSLDEVRKILERFDQDNSGTIDFEEYLTLIQHWIEQDEEQIYEAFKVFDRDGDGFVSAQELKRALTQYGEQFTEEEATEFFNMMDTDGDGVINYEEFVEYLRSMQKYSGAD